MYIQYWAVILIDYRSFRSVMKQHATTLVFLLTSYLSFSQVPTIFWTGAGSNDNWSNTENWDQKRLPISSDTVLVSTNDVTDVDVNITINNLIIENGATVGVEPGAFLSFTSFEHKGIHLIEGVLTNKGTILMSGNGDDGIYVSALSSVNNQSFLQLSSLDP